MKLSLRINFYTDGDYWVRDTGKLFDPDATMYKGADIQYQYKEDKDYDDLWFVLVCNGDANACRWAARDLLESLAVNFKVSRTHHWLVKDLYDLVMAPEIDALWSNDVHNFWTLSGNYFGTELSLHIEHKI